jgi:hypothetical protein
MSFLFSLIPFSLFGYKRVIAVVVIEYCCLVFTFMIPCISIALLRKKDFACCFTAVLNLVLQLSSQTETVRGRGAEEADSWNIMILKGNYSYMTKKCGVF